jgi:hypothetical protein
MEYTRVALRGTHSLHAWDVLAARDRLKKPKPNQDSAIIKSCFENFVPRITSWGKFYSPRETPACQHCTDRTLLSPHSFKVIWPSVLHIQHQDSRDLNFPGTFTVKSSDNNDGIVTYKLVSRAIHRKTGAGHFIADSLVSYMPGAEPDTMRYDDTIDQGELKYLGPSTAIQTALEDSAMSVVEYGCVRTSQNSEVPKVAAFLAQ